MANFFVSELDLAASIWSPTVGRWLPWPETITLIYLLCSAKPSAQGACVCVCVSWFHYTFITQEKVSVCMLLYGDPFGYLCLSAVYMYLLYMHVCEFYCSPLSSHGSLLFPVAVTMSGLLPTFITLHAAKPLHCVGTCTNVSAHGFVCVLFNSSFPHSSCGQSQEDNVISISCSHLLDSRQMVASMHSKLWYQIVLFQAISLD